MSSNTQFSYSSTSQSITSSTTGTGSGAPQTTSFSQTTHSDPSGTHVHRITQLPGQAPMEERVHLDAQGRLAQGEGGNESGAGRIEDVSEKDQEYLERMEDEYAKREGGA